MIKLSRILTVILCCAPAFAYGAGPVATTSGSNLTAYNPSTAYNNQWATISNARYDGDTNARVDFGNCNAVVLRCAQPKCANGGCTDASVAGAIVSGCVKANDSCKKYGDDLVSYMTAQLVANSTAKVQEQQMALEQAKIQAEAQGAAAVASMKTAATEAAQQTEAGITSYQQEAINRGISEDVLARQQITGQIMTEIENADLKLKEVKTAMQNSFEYAKCDARGNNCGAPKRIKKWRELASGFLEPYDETIDRIYDALVTAQTVGVDLSQIYMMLNDSCNSWGQYMCEKGSDIDYGDGKGTPQSCPKETDRIRERNIQVADCKDKYDSEFYSGKDREQKYQECIENAKKRSGCKPCTLLKVLTDGAEVYEGWINPTTEENQNGTVVACASNALDMSRLFVRRTKNKNGAGLVDIDQLDKWLNQVEPNTAIGGTDCGSCSDTNKTKCGVCYCGVDYSDNKNVLEQAMSKRSVSNIVKAGSTTALCVSNLWATLSEDKTGECTYINPIFAICDTHPYNANLSDVQRSGSPNTIDTENQEKMNEIIGLKITVISQQLYKQYEYLRATLQRLKIQLEKSVLTSNLEAAGAKSDSSSSSGGLLGGGTNKDSAVVLSGAINCSYQVDFDRFVDCISGNIQSIIRAADSADKKNACVQLQWDLNSVVSRLTSEGISATNKDNWVNCKTYMTFDADKGLTVNTGKQCTTNGNDKNKIKMCANEIISKLSAAKRTLNNQNKSLKELLGSI